MIATGRRRRRRGGGGVSLPTPTAYYTFNGNGTDNGTSPQTLLNYVSSTPGKIGDNCLKPNGATNAATAGATKFNPAGGDFTLAFWFDDNGSGNWEIDLNPSAYPRLFFGRQGAGLAAGFAATVKAVYNPPFFSTPSAGYHLMMLWYTGGELSVSLDNGAASPIVCPAPSLAASSALGMPTSGQAKVSELAWFKGTALTPTQRTALYNSGSGKTYNGSAWV